MRPWHRREVPDVRFDDLCRWFPRQHEAESAANTHQFTLYGGSRGPGKSYWLRCYLLRRLLRFSRAGLRGGTVGLFCENYPTLKDRQIGKIASEFPTWMGRVKDTQDRGLGFHVLPRYGGGALLLRRAVHAAARLCQPERPQNFGTDSSQFDPRSPRVPPRGRALPSGPR